VRLEGDDEVLEQLARRRLDLKRELRRNSEGFPND
jgi:hypothetical protein